MYVKEKRMSKINAALLTVRIKAILHGSGISTGCCLLKRLPKETENMKNTNILLKNNTHCKLQTI